MAFMDLFFHPSGGPAIIGGNWAGGGLHYRTDKNGSLSLTLVQGMSYRLRINNRPDAPFFFTCPALASANLLDHIAPYVTKVEFNTSSYTLLVDERILVTLRVTYSDLMSYPLKTARAVTLSADPEGLVRINGLYLTGLQAGVAELFIAAVEVDLLPKSVDLLEDPILHLPKPVPEIGDPVPLLIT
jgi:hypothetical protein